MKTLLVLRHAKANRESDSESDHDRTLAKRGVKAAERIGELLLAEKLVPELVLSSTAIRARGTAEIVAREAGVTERLISFLPQLYLAEPPAYLEALRKLPREAARVLVVGHNPGMETLVYRLTGETEHMPTAALAICELELDDWAELGANTRGHLVRVVRPKGLDE
jgi:phosphohistidine phosphatase